MGRYDQYSDEELIVRLREGETEISDYLMEKYKEFVRKKARAMFLIGGETDDLIQEGMIGLFKAIQNYQADKETSFRTFASLCIDRQLYSAVQNSNRQKHLPLNTYISLSNEEESEHLEGSWDSRTEAPESVQSVPGLRHMSHNRVHIHPPTSPVNIHCPRCGHLYPLPR